MSNNPTHGPVTSPHSGGEPRTPQRVKLAELLNQMRELEIDHEGKIYRLRLTQANKLILTA